MVKLSDFNWPKLLMLCQCMDAKFMAQLFGGNSVYFYAYGRLV